MNSNTTTLMWLAAIIALVFFVDVQSTVPLQATAVGDDSGSFDFGQEALHWWQARGGFERNLIIYTGIGLVVALVLKGIFRG